MKGRNRVGVSEKEKEKLKRMYGEFGTVEMRKTGCAYVLMAYTGV